MKGFSLVLLAACLAVAHGRSGHFSTWRFQEQSSEEFGQHRGPKSTSCPCGTTFKTAGRIVNGKLAKPNEYPHMVALIKSNSKGMFQFCGATILTPFHIITAAHCTHQWDPQDKLFALVGGHDLGYGTKYQKLYRVKEIINHPNYMDKIFVNDIAMLVVDGPIAFNEAVGPACLPSGPMDLVGEYVKVTGWGATKFKGDSSNVLLKVNLRVVPLDQCKVGNRGIDMLNPHQLCTYRPDKDACQGDSGGPVTWLDPETNRYTLVGLVSYGKGCATDIPGVNTDVWAFMKWIKMIISSTVPMAKTCSKIG